VGGGLIAHELGAGVALRVRPGNELAYRARWGDGREETLPDRDAQLTQAMATLESAIVEENERAQRLAEEQQQTARAAHHARSEVASLEVEIAAAEVERAKRHAEGQFSPTPAPAPKPKRPGLFARLFAFLRRLFGGKKALPTLPAPELEPARPLTLHERRDAAQRIIDGSGAVIAELDEQLAATKSRLAALTSEREERRRALDSHDLGRRQRAAARLVVLTGQAAAPSSVDIDIVEPSIPTGVMLLLPAEGRMWREPVDAKVTLPAGGSPIELVARIERARQKRPADLARRATSALIKCRNQIVDLERRSRQTHQERINELGGRRVQDAEALRKEELASAQLPLVRHAEEIVQEGATRLERLLEEARSDWAHRVSSCGGIEQLRAEVAAIEDGAAHRLSLVCDDLRETMTLQFVRLVLERSRALRQDLLRKRMEVARGQSPKLDETFEDIRVVLPATLEETFRALRAPDLGQLMSTERGLLDPLFRTLAREKRDCLTKLGARLDEIERNTARELYAAAVYLSPLLLSTFSRAVDELIVAHERWIDARLAEEQAQFAALRERQQPALDMVARLQEHEKTLASQLESYVGALGVDR
jgi:hypothetical protein